MSKSRESAANCWEIDRQTCGQIMRPFCVVILRNKKKTGKSVVKASSTDFDYVSRCVNQLSSDLYTLTNEEFVKKYNLSSVA